MPRHTLEHIMTASPAVPVLVIDDIADAVPLGRALVAGGIRVLEITLRTDAAFDAIRAIQNQVDGAIVGAGTVLTPGQVARLASLEVDFIVSPGLTPPLAAAAAGAGIPLLPGAVSASEIMAARELGLSALKFFPAVQSGGLGALKAFGSVFPDIRFCPTGGIGMDDFTDYLALDNVATVGGSWLAPKEVVAAKDWGRIESIARATAAKAGA